ncbi:MAG TPA: HAD family phosphatase [Vicinamibacterales bacterium]|nr:HAD family phosphatase [Vicinamibacterales bacterium]
MPTNPELLLFDFGGVLLEFAGPKELGRHLRWPSTPEVILKRWTECPHTDEFERGKLSPVEWAERFIREWDVDLTPDEFLTRFTTWSRRVLPGARELLEQLRGRYRLAALSNSNELHWERNTHELRIIELFEFAIASHEVGLCKPDPQIYQIALERAKVSSPEAIVFFDDLAANVEAAKSVGLRAYQVRGIDELRARIVAEGLL